MTEILRYWKDQIIYIVSGRLSQKPSLTVSEDHRRNQLLLKEILKPVPSALSYINMIKLDKPQWYNSNTRPW